MNSEVCSVLKEFEGNDVSRLILVKILSEDIAALSVSLAPLVGLDVENLKAEYTLPKLIHHRSPEHDVDLFSFPTEERVNVWKLAEVITAGISAALFKTGRNSAKLSVPGLASLVAALKSLTINGVHEGMCGSIRITIEELTSSMAKQLVAGNVHLICFVRVLVEESCLLRCCELDRVHGVRSHRVVQENILEALCFTDIVVVWDVNSERA